MDAPSRSNPLVKLDCLDCSAFLFNLLYFFFLLSTDLNTIHQIMFGFQTLPWQFSLMELSLTLRRVKDGPWDLSTKHQGSWLFETSFQFLNASELFFVSQIMTASLENTCKHCWRSFTPWWPCAFDVFYQTGPIVCICNAITLIMSAHSPVAHYLKWFMGVYTGQFSTVPGSIVSPWMRCLS